MSLILIDDETDKETKGDQVSYENVLEVAQKHFFLDFIWKECREGYGWFVDPVSKVQCFSFWKYREDVFCRLYCRSKWTKDQQQKIQEFLILQDPRF